MADEKEQLDSAPDAPENEGSPTPSVPSVPSADKPTSAPLFDPDALVEKLTERLDRRVDEIVDSRFKSAKDRRFADVELISKYLQSADGDVAKAARDMKLDEIYEKLNSEGVDGTAQGSESNQAFMEARTGQLLSDAGIDTEDPDYLMLVAQYGGRVTDPNQWLSVVEGFTATRQTKQAKQENIPGAAAASEGGNVLGAGGDEDIESLTEQLAKLQAQPATSETMAKRTEIRKRLVAEQDRLGILNNVTFDRS